MNDHKKRPDSKSAPHRGGKEHKPLKHPLLWDLLGVLLGIVVLIAVYFLWQYLRDSGDTADGLPAMTQLTANANQPYLLQEVDGRYKLTTKNYIYYLQTVDGKQEQKIIALYRRAIESTFDYLAAEGGVSSSYLVSRQPVLENVDIYVYNEICNNTGQSFAYQEVTADWQEYNGGPALLIGEAMLAEDQIGPLFYQMICQCLRLLSMEYDANLNCLTYGWQDYDDFGADVYGQAIDAGFNRWLGREIYNAYRDIVLQAPDIVFQAPYTALADMGKSLYDVLGQETVTWYVTNDCDSMSAAFAAALEAASAQNADTVNVSIWQAADPWKYFCQLIDPFDYQISGQAPADAAARYQEAMQIIGYLQ